MSRFGLTAIVVVLAGCGSVDVASDPAADTLLPIERLTQPAAGDVIEVLADSELARMLATEGSAPAWPVADGLSVEAGTGERWIASSEPPADDEVLALAGFFEIDGVVERVNDGGFGAEVRVGAMDGAAGMLVVSSYSEPVWYLQRSDAMRVDAGLVPCPTLAFDDPNAGQCAGGMFAEIAEPPSEAVAANVVDALMAVLGVPADRYSVETYSTPDTVNAEVSFGMSDAFGWSLVIAAGNDDQAVIVAGNGPLRAPALLDEVATVDLDEAMQRLGRLVPGVPVDVAADTIPATTAILVPITAEDGSVIATAPPATVAPAPRVIPTIETAEPAFATVWDVHNRQWLVPALLVTGSNGFTATVPTISADLVRVGAADEASVTVRTGPPLTVPDGSVVLPPPTTLSIPFPPTGPPPTGTVPSRSTPPPSAPPTGESPPYSATTTPGTTLFPRPTLPGPDATLLRDDGTPITIPIPPDPNEVNPDAIPDFYAESLKAVLVGRRLDEALTLLEATGWEARLDDLDDPNETFLTDLRSSRVTVQHRRSVVTAIRVG